MFRPYLKSDSLEAEPGTEVSICVFTGEVFLLRGHMGEGQGEGKEPGKDVGDTTEAKSGPLEAKGLQWYPQTSQFLHGGRPCGNRRPQPDVLDGSNLAEGNTQRKERLRAVAASTASGPRRWGARLVGCPG